MSGIIQALLASFSSKVGPFYLFTFGSRNVGQLGTGVRDVAYGVSSPVQIGTNDWMTASAGGQNAAAVFAVKENGQLWVWGAGTFGRLGRNDEISRSSPVQVGALTNWKKTSAGEAICVAIKTDSTMWAWGRNNVGDGTTAFRSSPVQIGVGQTWEIASSGSSPLGVAITASGSIWSWGGNSQGATGQNTSSGYTLQPTQIGALTDWAQASAGDQFCCAVKTDGTLWSWGKNDKGQLGLNISTTSPRSSPVQVGALSDWAYVSASSFGSRGAVAAVKTNGTLWTWGDNSQYGQLGLGDRTDRSSPVQVGALTNWSQVSIDTSVHCLAVKEDKTLWAWGAAGSGRIATSPLTPRSSPSQIGSLTTWYEASAGGNFSVALRS